MIMQADVLNLMHVGMDPEMTTGWIQFFILFISNRRNWGEKVIIFWDELVILFKFVV